MFRRKSLTGEVLHDGQNAYDSILKTTALKARAISQELAWANAEDNPYFMVLFGKLAEIHFMHMEAEKQQAERYLELNKAFRHIFQEERMLEETRKEQLNYLTKVTKIQRQLEAAKKKGDQSKYQSLEGEVTAQDNLYKQLSQSVEAKAKKLELYKVQLLKKGLKNQAEGILTFSGHCQHLYKAQMQLIDLLPDQPLTLSGEEAEKGKEDLEQQMSAIVQKMSSDLNMTAPPMGGVNLRRNNNKLMSSPCSSPNLNRKSMIESITLRTGKKDISKPENKLRHSSCSTDKLENMLLNYDPPPNNDHQPLPLAPPSPTDCATPTKAGVYCEIVIPSLHTKERPILAKSNSDSSVNRIDHTHEELMSSKLDKRLEEAGLLNPSHSPTSQSSTPYSSSEDIANNPDDPGYAKLSILTPPIPPHKMDTKQVEVIDEVEEDGYSSPPDAVRTLPPVPQEDGEIDEAYAVPEDALKKATPKVQPRKPTIKSLPTPLSRQAEEEEEAYAIPADAVKKVSPKLQQIQSHHRLPSTPSPPASPQVAESPRKREVLSGYESVDDIRKMREKQLREKEESSAKQERAASDEPKVPALKMQNEDGEQVYSQPFDALKGNRVRMASDATAKRPTWQRSTSNGKNGAEPSARFLHHVGSSTSIKSLPETTITSTAIDFNQPPEVPAHKRSASTNAKVMFTPRKPSPASLKSPTSPGAVAPLGGRRSPDKLPASPRPVIEGGRRSPVSPNKSPSNSTPPSTGIGRQRSHTEVTSPVSPKTGNLTAVEEGSTRNRVNRYILELENGGGDSRADTGRTHSVDSTPTPAKVTKLRNGRDCVTILSGKPKAAQPSKTGK